MKTLKHCARCGKCLPSCPSFLATGRETLSPRGRVALLEAGLLPPEETFSCLLCGACEAVCPNEVPLLRHLLEVRVKKRTPYASLLPPLLKRLRGDEEDDSPEEGEVVFFLGCMEWALYPYAVKALLALFPRGEKVILARGAHCCGLPYLAAGDLKGFLEAAARNQKAFSRARKVLTLCASCLFTFKKLYPLLGGPEIAAEDAISFLHRKGNLRLKTGGEEIFFQVPCHLRHLEVFPYWRELGLISYEGCCGQAGLYALKFPREAERIAFPLKKAFLSSGARVLATSCSGCFFRLRRLFPHQEVRPLVSYLGD